MDKSTILLLAVILLIQMVTVWLFYKNERKFALPVCVLLNIFTLSLMLIISDVISPNEFVNLAIVLVLQITGYFFLLKAGWQKAVLTAFTANITSWGIVFLLSKLMH